MILYCSDGRFGNQIFQYAFIKSIAKDREYILFLNLTSISKVLHLEFFGTMINNIHIIRAFRRILIPYLIRPLVRAKIVGVVKQDVKETEDGYLVDVDSFTIKKGYLPILFVETAFFQSEKFFSDTIKNNLKIAIEYLESARKFLSVVPNGYHKIFIHIRRGDYVTQEYIGQKGVCLPDSYYKGRIKWFSDNILNPFYIFISDDPDYVEKFYSNIEPKLISRNAMADDFAIMTLCDSAVISNSSFSWWGAYLMAGRYKVFAPKYWLGFKRRIDFPQGIQPTFAEAVDVECE